MKKKLEAELISIAHRILQHKNKASLAELKEEAKELYEKLTIMSFTEEHVLGPQPSIGDVVTGLDWDAKNESEAQEELEIANEVVETNEAVDSLEESEVDSEALLEDTLEINKEVEKPEIIIEEINARVTEDLFVPAATSVGQGISLADTLFEKNDMQEIGGDDNQIPVIDPDDSSNPINDQLKKGIHIELNDRETFIEHLFDGSTMDYNRVLSQLNTLSSEDAAFQFVQEMVKPDYNNWKNKQEYEERFMDIILTKFEN